jgi:hypothetical protein
MKILIFILKEGQREKSFKKSSYSKQDIPSAEHNSNGIVMIGFLEMYLGRITCFDAPLTSISQDPRGKQMATPFVYPQYIATDNSKTSMQSQIYHQAYK